MQKPKFDIFTQWKEQVLGPNTVAAAIRKDTIPVHNCHAFRLEVVIHVDHRALLPWYASLILARILLNDPNLRQQARSREEEKRMKRDFEYFSMRKNRNAHAQLPGAFSPSKSELRRRQNQRILIFPASLLAACCIQSIQVCSQLKSKQRGGPSKISTVPGMTASSRIDVARKWNYCG